MPAPVLAAIDLGTNNCRLLVAEPAQGQPQGFRVVDAFSRIVRLGEGFGKTGSISPEAVQRGIEALKVCREKIERNRVTHIRAVATEACRRADNGTDFMHAVRTQAGIPLEIITTAEEARLAMLGCTPLLTTAQPHGLIFDIGGGSTEIIWLRMEPDGRPALINHISVPYGVVNLTEQFGQDRVSDEDYRAMTNLVRGILREFDNEHGINTMIRDRKVQLAGCSGTITTLAAAHRNMVRYQRSLIDGSTMLASDARAMIDKLRVLDLAGRAGIPSIGQERSDLMVAGCAILQAIFDVWPIPEFRVGDRGLREGMLTDLLQQIGRP
ncbi:MAG: Ppx/GppA family phosphatase [Alphaproteobacteria bacterium]|nr:Ppx/GppA family phosphatase [Alphaproteobacteria bacterium]